jgi:hypothetical protein
MLGNEKCRMRTMTEKGNPHERLPSPILSPLSAKANIVFKKVTIKK